MGLMNRRNFSINIYRFVPARRLTSISTELINFTLRGPSKIGTYLAVFTQTRYVQYKSRNLGRYFETYQMLWGGGGGGQ